MWHQSKTGGWCSQTPVESSANQNRRTKCAWLKANADGAFRSFFHPLKGTDHPLSFRSQTREQVRRSEVVTNTRTRFTPRPTLWEMSHRHTHTPWHRMVPSKPSPKRPAYAAATAVTTTGTGGRNQAPVSNSRKHRVVYLASSV